MPRNVLYVPSCSSLGHFMITWKHTWKMGPIIKMLTLSRFHLFDKDAMISHFAHESPGQPSTSYTHKYFSKEEKKELPKPQVILHLTIAEFQVKRLPFTLYFSWEAQRNTSTEVVKTWRIIQDIRSFIPNFYEQKKNWGSYLARVSKGILQMWSLYFSVYLFLLFINEMFEHKLSRENAYNELPWLGSESNNHNSASHNLSFLILASAGFF